MFDRLASAVKSVLTPTQVSSTQQGAVDATFAPIAIGQILASVESLCVGSLYGPDQLLRGTSARSARSGSALHKVLTVLDSKPVAYALAITSLGSSIALLLSRGRRDQQIVAATALALSTALSEHRTPYGRDGADQMTSAITQYRAITALIPDRQRSDDVFLRAINIQAGLSYFVSGLSKLFGPSWVRGEAVSEILHTRVYGGSIAARAVKRSPLMMRIATWATPVWELSFPIVYAMTPAWGLKYLASVKGFHISVAAIMELPRFVWGFTGSHAAVIYVLSSGLRGTKRFSPLEYSVLGGAAIVAYVSAMYAMLLRQRDNARRRGLKGSSRLPMADGYIEFSSTAPHNEDVDPSTAPVIILEAGLGSALESWAWVAEELSGDHHVVSYHREGYGLTTSRLPAVNMVDAIIAQVDSTGPVIAVGHSFGLLKIAEYVNKEFDGRPVSLAVFVDGTDPNVLQANRLDRPRAAKYLQSQLGSMFVALAGIYNFVPHTVSRQSALAPDDQSGVVQFAFTPKNIIRATREYFSTELSDTTRMILHGPSRIVIASGENAEQQRTLAQTLSADYRMIPDSSHRSVIGYRTHALQIAQIVREAINDL